MERFFISALFISANNDAVTLRAAWLAGYQAGHDYVVELTNVSGTFSASDVQEF